MFPTLAEAIKLAACRSRRTSQAYPAAYERARPTSAISLNSITWMFKMKRSLVLGIVFDLLLLCLSAPAEAEKRKEKFLIHLKTRRLSDMRCVQHDSAALEEGDNVQVLVDAEARCSAHGRLALRERRRGNPHSLRPHGEGPGGARCLRS